jgi:predicted aspartyl protease
MGIINETIKVSNKITNSAVLDVPSKIDTGATMLVLPQSVVDELKLPVQRRATVKYANEITAERDIVWGVEVELCGRKGVFEAVVEPNKTYALLGAIVMETLDLIVEPRNLKIYANPRSVLPMAEIE